MTSELISAGPGGPGEHPFTVHCWHTIKSHPSFVDCFPHTLSFNEKSRWSLCTYSRTGSPLGCRLCELLWMMGLVDFLGSWRADACLVPGLWRG